MNRSVGPHPPAAPTPLPARQFQWFMLFWHVFLLGGLGVTLVMAWVKSGGQPAWRMPALAALTAVQAVLYFKTFVRPAHGTVSGRQWALYFAGSLGLWAVEARLEPVFEWLVGPYLGQMIGALPPKVSLPSALAVLAGYLGYRVGWMNATHLSTWQLIGGGSMIVAWIGVALFLHKLAVTSAERARLITELQAAQQELELGRERDAELAALRERERLARDLHDSLGHALVTLSVQTEAAQRLYLVDPQRASALMEQMKTLARTSMEDLRRSLANLRAPGLGDRQLSEALRNLCEQISQRSGLQATCQIASEVDRLPPRLSETLWRAAQEGLANAERHARARHLQLTLEHTAQSVALTVRDDGVGLADDAENKPGHFGLRGLRERVEGLGGTLRLAKAEPHGTLLEARLPVLN